MTQSIRPASHIILVVTGAAFDADALESKLAEHGLRLRLATRGDSALQEVIDPDVALVLLDAAQAGSGSFELCQRLIARASPRPLPLLLMSSEPSQEEQQRATQAGATGYLRMPFTTDDVIEKILIELTVRHAWPASDTAAGAIDTAALEVNYHTLLAGSPDVIMLFDTQDGYPIDINNNAERLFGRPVAELRRMRLLDLCPPVQPDGRPSQQAIGDLLNKVLGGEIRVFPISFRHRSGNQIDCEIRMVALNKDGRQLYHMRLVDVTGHKLAEALRAGQNQLLEMVARGAPLAATLDKLIRLVESQSPGVLCSVMLLGDDGVTLHPVAAPSLPSAFLAQLDGERIGPMAGSCGTAIFRKEAVIASDIAADPLWRPYAALAAGYGLRACWAMPILVGTETVLGSFAMYYRDVRHPGADEQRLIGVATHLASIAVTRTRREEELLRHRENLEELVAERTAELTRAKEQAEMANEELATALDNLSMTQDELVRRDKLAALGALVAGVAHELNTPIGNSLVVNTTMGERTRTLLRDLEKGLRRSDLQTYLELAVEADAILLRNLTRVAKLITSFKQIAVDTASSQRRVFRLDQLVHDLILPLHAAVKHTGLRVEQQIAQELELDSYPGPLAQALTALFENCLVHGLEGRRDGLVHIAASLTERGEIALSVHDNGAGIAPEHQNRVYDPFFTTKLGAGGSGLGLHITHNIVTGVLGGRLELDSSATRGTTFTLLLPPVAPL